VGFHTRGSAGHSKWIQVYFGKNLQCSGVKETITSLFMGSSDIPFKFEAKSGLKVRGRVICLR